MKEAINELEKLADAKSAPPRTEEGIAYHRGLSTNLDVRSLDNEFFILEGEEITHDAIEALIHQSRKSNRYKTVVAKWRKSLLADRNILLIPRIGVGYLVANASERLGRAQALHKQGVKRIYSSADIAAKTDRRTLDVEQKRVADFLSGNKAKVLLWEESKKLS
jgi:hypothetical protein